MVITMIIDAIRDATPYSPELMASNSVYTAILWRALIKKSTAPAVVMEPAKL